MQHLTLSISEYKHFTKTLITTGQTDKEKSLNKCAFNIQQQTNLSLIPQTKI